MAEYVTKYQVKEEILSWARSITNPERLIMADAMYVIDMLPSADVRPVVRGRWIDEHIYKQTMSGKTYDGFTYCSNCKHDFRFGYRSKFCPNCGADLRGGESK